MFPSSTTLFYLSRISCDSHSMLLVLCVIMWIFHILHIHFSLLTSRMSLVIQPTRGVAEFERTLKEFRMRFATRLRTLHGVVTFFLPLKWWLLTQLFFFLQREIECAAFACWSGRYRAATTTSRRRDLNSDFSFCSLRSRQTWPETLQRALDSQTKLGERKMKTRQCRRSCLSGANSLTLGCFVCFVY